VESRAHALELSPGHGALALFLEIHVDEHSGEDGALAPTIQTIPLVQSLARTPRLEELPGTTVAVPDDRAWDAWYGNDAAPLVDNRLELLAWRPGGMRLRWEAAWERPRRRKAKLVFEGTAAFAGVTLYVQDDRDLDGFVESVWGRGSLAQFEVLRVPGKTTLWPRFLKKPR
jgi:hypothetical protein